jgi:hypothetical protein
MSEIGRLWIALTELLGEHERSQALPTSARFLFYELVQRGVLSKERKALGRRRLYLRQPCDPRFSEKTN